MLDTILVAIDFSEQSRVALAQAASVAEFMGSKLTLLWVAVGTANAPSHAVIYGKAADQVADLVADLRSQSAARLEELAEPLRERGLEVDVRIEPGDADEVIVDVGKKIAAGLIVTGTKGLTGVKRFFLGSVAEKVVRASETHVLVARGENQSFTRILVPSDFSPASAQALELAVGLATRQPGPWPCVIDLLYAWQYPTGTHGIHDPHAQEGPLVALRDEIIRVGEGYGRKLIERYAKTGAVINFVQQHGPAAAAVQDRLEAETYDLVVMGTHGHRGFRRFMLGSVSEATVRHAPCSVLVVHADRVVPPG